MADSRSTITPNDLPHPFNLYKVLLNSDMLHFGYWEAGKDGVTLEEAQQAATALLLSQLPAAPARVLDIGCGLGATSSLLQNKGYEVIAISPDKSAIDYAEAVHPGPQYFSIGFLDDHPILRGDHTYDVVLMQESLQYFPELQPVFTKIKKLIKDGTSRIIICDEVSYDKGTNQFSVVKNVREIERTFHELGFFVEYHKIIGDEVAPTCTETLHRFEEKQQVLMDTIDDAPKYLEHYINGWRHQEKAYRNGTMGYEIWSLRYSDISTRNYRTGDESIILEAFNKTFNVNRSIEHWVWKFKENPDGGPYTSLSWDGDKIAAQITGYPLTLDLGSNQEVVAFHNGDTMVVPEYRGVGIGRNNLLSRTFRFFEKNVLPVNVFLIYGFNTGKIRRLCQLFLGVTVDLKVYEWNYAMTKSTRSGYWSRLQHRIYGFSIAREETVGDWANEVYKAARKNYPWLIKRDKTYLHWRYDQQPDFSYSFYVVKRWGKPLGWFVVRKEGEKIYLVDALLNRQKADTILKMAILRLHTDYPEAKALNSWFSEVPEWWNKLLADAGFEKHRQFQELYLACKSYDKRVTTQMLADNFYFTMGDGDLY